MNNGFIGVLLAIGIGGWVFAKTQKSTGNNTKTALIVAGVAAFFAFILMLTILSFVPGNN